MKSMAYWIEKLELMPHPEGGYFSEVYRSNEMIAQAALPGRYHRAHSFSTSIYFLIPGDSFSALHRLRSDEIWHFYYGAPLTLTMIWPDGKLEQKELGPELDKGQQFQIVIPHGVWFGGRPKQAGGYTLIGCTVAPGFEYEDFELAKRQDLLARFPEHADIIRELTRQ